MRAPITKTAMQKQVEGTEPDVRGTRHQTQVLTLAVEMQENRQERTGAVIANSLCRAMAVREVPIDAEDLLSPLQ